MRGPGCSMHYPTTHTTLSPIRRGFAPGFVNYKEYCIRLAAVSDKVYQLIVHGRWFSPGTPASFTTKTGRHDIAEILLEVALNTIKSINQIFGYTKIYCYVKSRLAWSYVISIFCPKTNFNYITKHACFVI